LTDPEELEYIGIREYLKPRSLQLIEWPELGKGALAKPDILIKLSGNGDSRNAKITFQTELGQSIKECAVG
jgi:tRNA threonylcarbamoyladenosine biosynthesis protein TsaE